MKCKIQKAFWLKALKPSVPAAVKWSEVKPRAHLWPQFQPEPGSGSLKMVEGQKSRVKDGETSGLATLTRRRSIVEKSARLWRWSAGNARAVQGKVGAAHRSQPSTNPHHLPGFKSINSSLPFGSVLDLAGRVPAN